MGKLRFLRNPFGYGRLRGQLSSVPPPTAPSGLTATVLSGTSVKLDWVDNSSNEDAFSVEQDTVEVATPAANAITQNVASLTAGTPYTFRVRAHGAGGYSAYTSNVTATPAYQYGYPAFTANGTQPNVVAQWLFDEASGDIVDEVSAITIADTGTPTYNQAVTGDFAGISPGIKVGSTPAGYFGSAATSVSLGTSDFTMEIWFSTTDSTGGQRYLYRLYPVDTTVEFNPDSSLLKFTIRSVTLSFSVAPALYADGSPHKLRITADRNGNGEIFLDGVSMGTGSIASQDGWSIDGTTMWVGGYDNTYRQMGAAIPYEIRLSTNLTNNSGGPGGG